MVNRLAVPAAGPAAVVPEAAADDGNCGGGWGAFEGVGVGSADIVGVRVGVAVNALLPWRAEVEPEARDVELGKSSLVMLDLASGSRCL